MKTKVQILLIYAFSKSKVLAMGLMLTLISTVALSQPIVPFSLVNRTNPAIADANIYVAVVGMQNGAHVWIDTRTGQVLPMNPSYNTVQGPSGSLGPGGNGRFANCFARLSEIPNKVINIPGIAGCRILISFNQQLYLYFFGSTGAPSGYAAPDLNNPSDPNQGIRFEMIELTNAPNGLWANTTRVDHYQYPMGLEVWGAGFYGKTGELMTHAQILSQWQATAPAAFQGLRDAAKGIIHFPSKTAAFRAGGVHANYFQGYIDQIWAKYSTGDLVFNSGHAGVWRGRVTGGQFRFTRASDGQVAIIPSKPTTQDALEAKGPLATGAQWDLVVQAQIAAAINRHAIDLNLAVGATQDFATPSRFYIVDPYNWYAKFFHRTDISFNGRTYAFSYDDVFDQSSTLNAGSPQRATISIGGFAGGTTPPPPPPPTGIVSGGVYSLINVHSNKAMEVGGFSTVNGGNVQQWDYVGAASQKWRATDVGGGAFSLINIHSGKSLDVAGVSSANGGNLHQWDYVGGNNQKWQIIANGDGTYRIISVHSGKAAETGGFSTANGGNVQQWDYVAANSQKWRFTQVAARLADSELSETQVQLYPNPAAKNLFISSIDDLAGVQFKIISAQGNEIMKGVSSKNGIDVSSLKPGIYSIAIKANGKKITRTFIKD